MTQPVLPLLPAEATPIGPIAGLVQDPDEGGVVFVSGLATFAFTPDDELARRLAAVQLVTTKIARASEVASGSGSPGTRCGGGGGLWRPTAPPGWCPTSAARKARPSSPTRS